MDSAADVLRSVVDPAIRAVFADHEVTAVHLSRSPRGGWTVRVVAVGETFDDWVVQGDATDVPLADYCERLRSNLVDFVAESRFGWGQDREAGPPA